MPRKQTNDGPIDYARLEKMIADNPDDFFSAEETERRMAETMRRMCGQGPGMNLKTGQNLKEPFLTEADLKQRGYPCNPGFE